MDDHAGLCLSLDDRSVRKISTPGHPKKHVILSLSKDVLILHSDFLVSLKRVLCV